MPQLKRIPDPTRTSLTRWAAVPLLFAGLLSTRSMAQQPGQKSYGSSKEASLALVMAAQKNDGKALLEILGPDGKTIVSSGDATEDANDRAVFVEKYHEMNRLVKEPDGRRLTWLFRDHADRPH